NFNQAAAAQADDVDIDVGFRVFVIVQVEHRFTAHDPRTHRSDAVAEDRRGPVTELTRQGICHGDEGGGDGGRAGAAAGVEHVGVDVDGPGAKRLAIDDGAEAAAD